VLCIFENESDLDITYKFEERVTGAQFPVRLAAGRAALALIDKTTKQIVAKYNLP